MENTLPPNLDKMLSVLRQEGPSRGDRFPMFFDGEELEPDTRLEPGLTTRALELLAVKMHAGAELNDLEALGANLLRIMANQMNWDARPPRPAPPVYVRTRHTAIIRGSYTIAGSIDGFASFLQVELLSGEHAQLLDTHVVSCIPKEGEPGLLVIDVEVELTFTIQRKKDDAPLETILAGMGASVKHPLEALAPVPRMLRHVTTFTV